MLRMKELKPKTSFQFQVFIITTMITSTLAVNIVSMLNFYDYV